MKQGQFNKNFQSRNLGLATSRSGQALIEYVLLLFVSIALLMGAKQVLTGIGKFIDGYMGEYVRCLMDHGELPSRGVSNDDLKKSTEGSYICANQYTFSVSTGFTYNGSGAGMDFGNGSGSNSSSGRNSNSNSNANKTGSNNESKSGDSVGETSGSSASDIASRERRRRSRGSGLDGDGSGGSNFGNSSNRSRRVAFADGDDEYGSSNSRVVGEVAGAAVTDADQDSEMARSGRARYRAINGKMAEEIEKNSKKAQTNSIKPKPGIPATIAETEDSIGPRKSTFSPMERRPTQIEEEEETSFSVGNFFKWIIIIVLIIVIVIFFGGQILNYSKSDN